MEVDQVLATGLRTSLGLQIGLKVGVGQRRGLSLSFGLRTGLCSAAIDGLKIGLGDCYIFGQDGIQKTGVQTYDYDLLLHRPHLTIMFIFRQKPPNFFLANIF